MGPRSEPAARQSSLTLLFAVVGLLVIALDSLGDEGYSTWSNAPAFVYLALAAFATAAVLQARDHLTPSVTSVDVELAVAGFAFGSAAIVLATGVGSSVGGVIAVVAALGLGASALDRLRRRNRRVS